MAAEAEQDSFLRSLVRDLDKDKIFVSDRDLPSSRSDAAALAQACIMLDVLVHDALGQAIDQSIVKAKPMNRTRLEKVRAQIAALPYVSSDLSQAELTARAVAVGVSACASEAMGIRGAEATAAAIERACLPARLLGMASLPAQRRSSALANGFEAVAHALDKYGFKGATGKEAVAAVVQRGIDTCSAVSKRDSTAESPVLVTFARDLGMRYPLANTGASSAVEEDRAHLLASFVLCRLAPMLWRFMYHSGAYKGVFTGAPPIRPSDEAKIVPLSELFLWGNRLQVFFVPTSQQRASEGMLQEQVAQAWKLIERVYQTFFHEVTLSSVIPKSAIPRVIARDAALAAKYVMAAGVDEDDVMDAARETIAFGMVLN